MDCGLAEYLAYFAAGKRPTLLVAYLQLATEGASHAAAVLQPFFASYERACDHLGLAVHLVHFSRADALDPGKLYFVGAGAAAVEHGLQAFQVSGLEGRMAHHPVHHRPDFTLGKSVKKDCLYQLLFTIRQQRQGGFQPVHHDRIDNGFCNVHRFISDKVQRIPLAVRKSVER